MNKPQISKSAITSLVTGLLFFIPIITGLIALVFGAISIKAIKKSKDLLLGKGMALTGLFLGFLNIIVWSFILFNNPIYTIGHNEEAIIFHENEQKHIVIPGVHFLNPITQRVTIYDTTKVYSGNTGELKYLLFNSKPFEMNVAFKWRICVPKENADNFLGLDTDFIEHAISKDILNVIRVVLISEKIIDPKELGTQKFHNAVRKKIDERVKDYGVCLASDLENNNGLLFQLSLK